ERVPGVTVEVGTRSRLIRGGTSDVQFGVPPPNGRRPPGRPAAAVWDASGVACLERVCGRATPDAPETRRRSKALHRILTIGRPAADQAGARPYQRNMFIGNDFGLSRRRRSMRT